LLGDATCTPRHCGVQSLIRDLDYVGYNSLVYASAGRPVTPFFFIVPAQEEPLCGKAAALLCLSVLSYDDIRYSKKYIAVQ
jgi:hypothetical protein